MPQTMAAARAARSVDSLSGQVSFEYLVLTVRAHSTISHKTKHRTRLQEAHTGA
jgi:hypothetical protein